MKRNKFRVKESKRICEGWCLYTHYKVQMRVLGIWWTIKTFYNEYPDEYKIGEVTYAYECADAAVDALNMP